MGAYVAEHQRDWDQLAAVATHSYNIKPQSSTGFSPFELVSAALQATLLPQVEISSTRRERTKAQLRDKFPASVAENCKLVRETLQAKQLRYKQAYDSHLREMNANIAIGDLVYVKPYVSQKDLSKKLIFPAAGPFSVAGVSMSVHTVSISTLEGRITVAGDRVRKCTGPRDLRWGMKFTEPLWTKQIWVRRLTAAMKIRKTWPSRSWTG
jgi:hypothetical protein